MLQREAGSSAHTPAVQTASAPHAAQAAPPVPQAIVVVPPKHVVPLQQPAQLAGPHEGGGHAPQSLGQLVQLSVPLHTSSPQPAQAPQSAGQFVQLSPPTQTPSPQPVHVPQSPGQVLQVSLPLHSRSPQ